MTWRKVVKYRRKKFNGHRLQVLPSTRLVMKIRLFTEENDLQQILHRSFSSPNKIVSTY